MIFYFSGTGNSEYIAKKLSEQIQDEVVSINGAMKKEEHGHYHSVNPLVFVSPTYAWQLPRVVTEYIRASEFTGSQEAYFIMTCGEDIGNAEKYIKKLCHEKGLIYKGVVPVVMPENYITMYSAPEKNKILSLVREAEPVVIKAAEKIRVKEHFESQQPTVTDQLKSSLVNGIFYPIFVGAKGYYATAACVNCGKCEGLCPLNNIHMASGKPVWGMRCTQCMACICGCPVEAIEYKNKTQGKARYWCPKAGDMV